MPRREQMKTSDLAGTVDYDAGYDYKKRRRRELLMLERRRQRAEKRQRRENLGAAGILKPPVN